MGEGDDQEGSRSGPFGSFWQKSLGKVGKGSSKNVKFVSGIARSGESGSGNSDSSFRFSIPSFVFHYIVTSKWVDELV